VFAELGYTDLAGWRAWADYPVDVRQGQGALRLWATLGEGKVLRATADVALTKVVARLASDLPPLQLQFVRGRVQGRQTAHGYEFGVRNLALATGRGPEMRASSFRASWEPPAANRPGQGSVSANLLELGPIAHLAEFVPFPADLRKLLAELAPQGNLLDLKFDWSGELPDAARYNARTRFTGLTMNAWRSVPGFSGMSGTIEANERKGTLYLAAQNAELELPRVFPEPRLQFDTLTGQIEWERPGPEDLRVRLASLGFANADLAGTAYGSYALAREGPGTIDLSAQFARADGRRAGKYIPLASIVGEKTRDWLAGAILEGQATDARLRLKGDLRDFPFADPQKGQFQVLAHVGGGRLEYASGWPRIEAIEGDLQFERDRIEIVGRSGAVLGAKLHNVRASIPSLLGGHPVLVVTGEAEGPTRDFLEFIRLSPVNRSVGGFADGMDAQGRGKLSLKLELPLADLARARAAGEFQFAGNNVTFGPRLPAVERAGGKIGFTESTLAVHDVRGQMMGGPIAIEGGTRPDKSIVVTAKGSATVPGLQALLELPGRRQLGGSAAYTASATVREGRLQLNLESSLRGAWSELPPPLTKEPGEILPLRVDVLAGEVGQNDRISVRLGRIVAAEFLRGRQGEAMAVQRAALVFNPSGAEPVRLPERRGLLVYGTLASLDIDRWEPFLNAEGAAAAGTAFDLRIGILDAYGKRLRDVALRGGADSGGWSANVASAEAVGDLVYRSEAGGKLVARLQQFTVPDDVPGAKPGDKTRELPALDLVAESFVYHAKKLGRVEIAAQHDGPNWRIEKLAMVNPDASFSGRGMWVRGDNPRTSLSFRLDSRDAGKFLERVGYPGHIEGGQAVLEGALAWNGDPTAVDFKSLTGDLSLQADKGQFPEIDAGIGRVLGVLNLQLSDLFAKGYQFDTLSGSFQADKGVLSSKDVRLRGAAAQMDMSGEIDLAHETQNLRIRVVPSLKRGVSTLLGLVNPVVGLGAAVAQGVLKDPIGQLFTYEYAVTGGWAEPKIARLGGAKDAAAEKSVPPKTGN
jgi:uncharacterized protein (TIGR02099 family)